MTQQATLHARTPFVFGSAEKVARVDRLPGPSDRNEVNALFGNRGLFRA
jgi:fructose-1,6-bisphosphatase I